MIYFDNAATGMPKSKRAAQILYNSFLRSGNYGRSSHKPAMRAAEGIYRCRQKVSEHFGVLVENVILTPSCTYSLNFAVKGFIKRGKVVISNLEHNSVCRPLYALQKEGRIEISVFDALNGDVFANFVAAAKNASAAVITYASNVCGKILPVKRIADYARKNNIFLCVDAAQAAGYISINCDADVVCVAGHKGFNGPMGTGLMLINQNCKELPTTIIEGGAGIYSLEKEMPECYPERFEAGTLNAPAFEALAECISRSEKQKFGINEFKRLVEGLKNIEKIKLYGAPNGNYGEYVPTVLFNIEGMESDEVMNKLAEKDICVRSGFHCSPLAHEALKTEKGGVRVSPGKYNTITEVNRFLYEVNKLAK